MRWVWTVGALGVLSGILEDANAQALATRHGALPGRQAIRAAIARAGQLGARTGVCVLDDRGAVVFESRADEAFVPSSNLKVLTAAALLRGLGKHYEFRTRFEVRNGMLVVHSGGDPNWLTASVTSPEVMFGEVAAALQRGGVRALRGISLAPGTFVGPARPADWPKNQLHTYYAAPTGPFVLEQGIFRVVVDARGSGRRARLRFAGPLVGPRLTGGVTIVDQRVSTCGAIDRGDRVFVRGKQRRGGTPEIRTAVADPAVWYERSLRHLLARAGIAVRSDAPSTTLGEVHVTRTSLAPALLRILEDSSNFDAEQCARVLGHEQLREGSLAAGVRAVRDQIEALAGPLPQNVKLADASGLSKNSRLTPRLLATVLHALRGESYGEAFRQALPIGGRTGKLHNRFTREPLRDHVFAKTGWVAGSSTLSGYVDVGAARYTFSILMNYDRRKGGLNKDLKRQQERIVAGIITP
ncbi:MAG: D-alanyl-D-alanine carboxypeptidase/D-alanyl-D-alanine-endopeptidase [bacterium]|nr:D-alanyl-D-alanine carboxypeptidase/D-alanyl-D-alanine-endopeptidase [bacterium]